MRHRHNALSAFRLSTSLSCGRLFQSVKHGPRERQKCLTMYAKPACQHRPRWQTVTTRTIQPLNCRHPGATAVPGDGYSTAIAATSASERTNLSLKPLLSLTRFPAQKCSRKLQINCLDSLNCANDVLKDRGCATTISQEFNNWPFHPSGIP